MSKVIVSYADGPCVDLLNVALPTFYKYANLHNYDLFVPSAEKLRSIVNAYNWTMDRPTSWLKVPLVKYLLTLYDTVLWIDSDIVINKFDVDIFELSNKNSIQSFVTHNVPGFGSSIPNCGVWILNKYDLTFQLLNDIWNRTDCLDSGWWEQMANIVLMRWNANGVGLSIYGQNSSELPFEFNVHKNDVRFDESSYLNSGRFLHATMWDDRLQIMKNWIQESI